MWVEESKRGSQGKQIKPSIVVRNSGAAKFR
jgi:hypothetical protein